MHSWTGRNSDSVGQFAHDVAHVSASALKTWPVCTKPAGVGDLPTWRARHLETRAGGKRMNRDRALCLMRVSVKSLWTVGLIAAVVAWGCSPRKRIERDLQITFGGFVKGGNEEEKIEGTCRSVETGNVLNCDIYNGLTGWRITELVIRITWAPYSAEDVRDFRRRGCVWAAATGAA